MIRLGLKWRPGRLAKNTAWLTVGNGLRILVQAAYFILIARALGARGYGAFAGVVALATVLGAFSGWGAGFLLVKNVARRPDRFPLYWGRSLVTLGASGFPLVALALALSAWLLPSIPVPVIMAVALSDLLFTPLAVICAQAFQAFQRLTHTALMLVLHAAFRLAAAGVMLLTVAAPTPEDWAGYYLAGTVLASLACLIYVWRTLGAPRWSPGGFRDDWREGTYFSVSQTAQRANNDIDKTLLVRLSTLEAAGIYSAAFRLVEVVFMPVNALVAAAYARFFQHGARGIRGSLELVRGLMAPALGYAIVGSVAIYLLAPLIPTILGPDYEETVNAARWLAVLPVVGTLYVLAAHALSGAGHQRARSAMEIAAAVLNVLLNLWWIPLYSYHGAVWAMLVSRTIAAAGVWYWSLRTRNRRPQAAAIHPGTE